MQHLTNRLRRGAAALAVAAALPVLSGCASNFDSQVQQPYTPGIGVYDKSGTAQGFNMVIVANGEGSGTLVATMLNEGEETDTLTGVEVETEGDRTIAAELTEEVKLPPEQLVQLHESQAVTFSGEGMRPGWFVELTLEFATGEPIVRRVPIESHTGPYAEIIIP
ncbi:MAG TPA: hypothetical protein VFJ14_05675 [Nocardioidaceae bacterium]|nr:hypothetical protein [Nocardioidaceae bacterium]